MGHRNPSRRWHRHCRGDTRHDLDLNPRGYTGDGLLATSAEHKWISTLEAYHDLSFASAIDQKLVDVRLR